MLVKYISSRSVLYLAKQKYGLTIFRVSTFENMFGNKLARQIGVKQTQEMLICWTLRHWLRVIMSHDTRSTSPWPMCPSLPVCWPNQWLAPSFLERWLLYYKRSENISRFCARFHYPHRSHALQWNISLSAMGFPGP